MRLEHHLVGGYVRYISPYIIIIITRGYDFRKVNEPEKWIVCLGLPLV